MATAAERQARNEQLLRVLEQEKPNFSKFEEHEVQKAEAWSGELAMLRRRVKTRFETLPLPGGDSIAVRTCLTESEEAHLAELFVKIFGKGDQDAPYEVIELCTANPEITEEWLRANPDAFAVQDLLDVLYGYLERKQALRQEAADRVRRIVSFRIERDGQSSG
jgi:hypothetical protein